VWKNSADKFWIPSFFEIFGRNPSFGLNGDINYSVIGSTREGSGLNKPFKLFDPTYDEGEIKRSVPYSRDLRVMLNLEGDRCKWYTRSIDPTSPGRVFYIDDTLPVNDDMANIALTCTAHRDASEDPIGAVVCFTIS
jgi:hypothetical protein